MNEPSTVTYATADILRRIENKLDKLEDKIDKQSEKIGSIEVKMATLTEKTNGMDKRLEKLESEQATMVKAISDLQGFRSLILPVIVGGMSAIIGGIVTAVVRWLFITPNP